MAQDRPLAPGKNRLVKITRFDGTSAWFKRAIAETIKASAEAVNDRRHNDVASLRKYAMTLHDLAQTWIPYSGFLELEQEHEKLVEYHENVQKEQDRRGAQLGPASGLAAPSLAGGSRSIAPVRDDGAAMPDRGRPGGGDAN